jgi:cell division protein FtsA
MQAERYIAAADLGSSKIALSVAKIEGDDIQIIYYKETPSDGIRNSYVFNPKRAAGPLRAAISEAEGELNIKILQVVVGLPRYDVRQEIASARMERSDPASCITRDEINTLKSIAIDSYPIADESKEEIYGAVAQSFSADEELVCANEHDVVGVTADAIEGNFKVFVGAQKAVSNVDIMLNEVGVAPARKMFLPNTVARAVLSEAENAVADGERRRAMRHNHNRTVREGAQISQKLRLGRLVKGACGLVKHKYRCAGIDRSRDGDPLHLSLRETSAVLA